MVWQGRNYPYKQGHWESMDINLEKSKILRGGGWEQRTKKENNNRGGEKSWNVDEFIYLGSKIITDLRGDKLKDMGRMASFTS